MSVEGAQQQEHEGQDSCFVVASPPRSRLRFFAHAAARAFLSALVRKARSSAVVDERPLLPETAMVIQPSASVDEEEPAAAAAAEGERGNFPDDGAGLVQRDGRRGGSGPRPSFGGVVEEGSERENGGSGSDSSSSSSSKGEGGGLRGETTLVPNASEAGW